EEVRARLLGARVGPDVTEPHAKALGDKYAASPYASDTAAVYSGQVALAYDAAWTLALAVVATAADGKPLIGDNISPNVRRLEGGPTPFNPDQPANMASVVSVLRSGGSIDYVVASSDCNWDENNDAEPTILSWCVSPQSNANKVKGAGLTFDST